MLTKRFIYLSLFFLSLVTANAQDEDPFVTYDVPSQNLLKYNRFLINPTFSTVREDKSYVNLLHRNQSATIENNNQSYFLSYSGRINDRTGLGLSLYSQTEGTVTNFGILANYAYGLKLSDKSNFTFGANVSYYNSGFDENRAVVGTQDPTLLGLQDSNLLSFQPGFNISYNNFDLGVFAENLFDYNLKNNESVTEFKEKTFSTHLQYTHPFNKTQGILEGGRIMPLVRARKVGESDVVLGGSLIMDLPKIGWLQGGYDSFYGASAGIGFNLNQRLSLGYTMEKGLSSTLDNFGLTHEISFAYSFTPNLTEDRVMLEDDYEDELASNDKDALKEDFTAKDEEIDELKRRLAENDDVLAELMYRQDSIESNRRNDLERRFEMVMRMVRNENNGNTPQLEKKAKKTYFLNNDATKKNNAMASEENNNNSYGNSDGAPNTNTVSTALAANDRLGKNNVASSENGTGNAYNKANNRPIGLSSVSKDALAVSDNKRGANKNRTAGKKDAFTIAANKHNIKSKKFRNLDGVEDGYYIVANVYKGDRYLNKFVNELNDQGVPADYFTNHKNGLKYVFLERHETWQEAMDAHNSNVGGNYDGTMWIMNVDNSYTNDAYANNVDRIKEKASQYATDVLQKNVIVRDGVADNTVTPKNLNLSGVGTGYYIIANVFANVKNANRFVKLMNSKGLNAGYFVNPENNYRYVYLKKHTSWNNALISYYSNLNSSYEEKMWIMRVNQDAMA